MQSLNNKTEAKDSPIFIVDDEPVNIKLIERILNADGYTNITCIESAAEVAVEYEKSRPNLILLDVNMPVLSGFGVLEQLKNIENMKLPPVVFITAQDTHEYRVKAYEQGVLDYISKPFNRVELLSRVKNLLALELAYQSLEYKNQSLEEIVSIRTNALWETQLEVVQKLGRAAEYRDNETGAHIIRMSNNAALITKHLGYKDDFSKSILYASPMHDIGKIAIPDHILLKPGKLTPEEWEIMKSHTTIGAEILSGGNSDLMKLAAEISISHHEKWDGSGYPYGLSGKDIPLSSRIVAVSDVFDALVSERPYKKAWGVKEAKEFINEQSEVHFDPEIVAVFNKVFPEILEIRNRYSDPDIENQKGFLLNNLQDSVLARM